MNKKTRTLLLFLLIVVSAVSAGFIFHGHFTGEHRPVLGGLIARPGENSFSYSTAATPLEAMGEAHIPEGMIFPDDRTRVAAILDAVHKLAIKMSRASAELLDQSGDTVAVSSQWDGLSVEAFTIKRNGFVLSDNVVLHLSEADEGAAGTEWRLNNLHLTSPAETEDPQLNLLTEALLERNLDLTGGQRIGRNIWQETLCMQEWNH